MEKIFQEHPWIIAIILIWTLPWKAAALWRSARRGHFGWFFALLIINSLAILDILYFFIFSKPKSPKKQEQAQPEKEAGQGESDVRQSQASAAPTNVKVMIV